MLVEFRDASGFLVKQVNCRDEADADLAIEALKQSDLTASKINQVKAEKLKALKDKHAAMKPQDLDTLVEMRQAIIELQEIIGLR